MLMVIRRLKFLCTGKDCEFHLVFVKEVDENSFSLVLSKSDNYHNHPLKIKVSFRERWTEEIKSDLVDLMGKLDTRLLTKLINKRHQKVFIFEQISGRTRDLFTLHYGKCSEDAQRLVSKLKSIQGMEDGTLKVKIGANNQQEKLIFISKRMKSMYNHFNDILIIDTTFKKIGLIWPILDFVGVDNYGHNGLFSFLLDQL